MSDFLNNFETDEYKGEQIVDGGSQSQSDNKDNKHSQEEVIRVDSDYQTKRKKRKLNYIIGGIGATLLIAAIAIVMNLVTLPNFIDRPISDVKGWAQENNIKLEVEENFSVETDENSIIKQAKKPGSRIFKRTSFKVAVSKGADPDEKIAVPNLRYMSLEEINEWKDKNRLDNVLIEAVNNNKYPEGKVMSIDFDDDFVNAGNYFRKDNMTVKVSKGRAGLVRNIIVPDFKEGDKYDAKDWAEENNVSVIFNYTGHPKTPKNGVIKQDTKKNTKIARGQAVTLLISRGKPRTVPSFKNMKKEEVGSAKVPVTIKTIYSNKSYGKYIGQSVPAGSTIYGGSKVVVTYSEGKPFIDDLTGMTEKQVDRYFYTLNLKGANLKVVKHRKKAYPKGVAPNTVYDNNHKKEYVDIVKKKKTVVVYLYKKQNQK